MRTQVYLSYGKDNVEFHAIIWYALLENELLYNCVVKGKNRNKYFQNYFF